MTCRQIENLFEMERRADEYWNKKKIPLVFSRKDMNGLLDTLTNVEPGRIIRVPRGASVSSISQYIQDQYVF